LQIKAIYMLVNINYYIYSSPARKKSLVLLRLNLFDVAKKMTVRSIFIEAVALLNFMLAVADQTINKD
jgi:hypothetical protein